MKAFVRGLAAVVLGLIAFVVVAGTGEAVGIGAFVSVLVSWALGAFAGGWVAARLAPSKKIVFGLVIGAFGLVAAIFNMLMIPHPAWVWVVGLAEFIPAAYLGARLALPSPSTAIGPPEVE
jgi:hypothetical protein